MTSDDILNEKTGDCNEFVFELPKEYGGSLDSKDVKTAKDSLMAFDITTGAQAAQEAFEAKENLEKVLETKPAEE